MNTEEIRELYDEEQRRNVEFPGMRREEVAGVVRYVSEHDKSSVVLYSRLDTANVEEAIRGQVAYFEGLGHEFEWKVFGHDTPPDLPGRLAAHGFEVEELEAIVVLDLEKLPARLAEPVAIEVRRVAHPAELDELIALEEEVWSEDKGWLREMLTYELSTTPEQISVYVAYASGRPASAGWVRFDGRGRWGGLWGGSTLPAYRNRGIYTGLVALRAQEARRRGVRFLTVDASPMSRPILEKLGFRQITTAIACNWSAGQGE